ncbi:MAG: hypothetical protein AAGB19_11235 [Cyanobacteria bacterium P01_F01_bin.3]
MKHANKQVAEYVNEVERQGQKSDHLRHLLAAIYSHNDLRLALLEAITAEAPTFS